LTVFAQVKAKREDLTVRSEKDLSCRTGLGFCARPGAAMSMATELRDTPSDPGPAPLAAIGTPVIGEFFSARVNCHVSQPLEFGADLG
jgi:hypothetical protein